MNSVVTTFELKEALEAEKAVDDGQFQLVREGGSSRIDSWRDEIAVYFAEMQKFQGMDPVEVFLRLSAFSARVSEIRFFITQHESRRAHSFRIQAVDPFLEECERQFKFHSRIQSTREMEFRISGGAP